MKMSTYALVLFCTVIICFIASYDRRLRFDRYFKTYLLAASIVAIPFLLWDIWFTARGVWWFNQDYTVGLTLWGLPIEEWLFFFCIPFSCTFTYYCVEKYIPMKGVEGFNNMLVFSGTVAGTLVALFSTYLYATNRFNRSFYVDNSARSPAGALAQQGYCGLWLPALGIFSCKWRSYGYRLICSYS
jgi:lycopene cyclase domain-containing protein